MASWAITTLFLVAIFSLRYNSLKAQSADYSVSSSNNLFANELMQAIVDKKSTENIVYSPTSIYSNLVISYIGAERHTADELSRVLQVNQVKKKDFCLKYGRFLKSLLRKTTSPQLTMVNRIYVDNKIKVTNQFKLFAKNVDFSKSLTVAENINKWVEEQTENKIKNLISPNSLDKDTAAISVNTLYFKAKWLKPFKKVHTHKKDFYVSPSQKVQVDTMFTIDKFRYAKLPDINAEALEMPYANSDISMLVILPNDRYGLQKLEDNLNGKNLNEIAANMSEETVGVHMPKFRIEYEIDLKEPLKKMGISSMFETSADLSGMFEGNYAVKISDVKHKAVLECDETSTEAAATTSTKVVFRTLRTEFRVNHPFVFAIRTNTTVLFAGHVAKL